MYYVNAFSSTMTNLFQGTPYVTEKNIDSLCYYRALRCMYDEDEEYIEQRRTLLYEFLRHTFDVGQGKTLTRYKRILPIDSDIPRILKNICTAYNDVPNREFDTDNDIIRVLYQSPTFNASIRDAYRKAKLCSFVAVRPFFLNQKLRLDVLTPDLFRVSTDATGFLVEEITYPQWGERGQETVTWNANTVTYADIRGNVTEQRDNPYGLIPFAFMRLKQGDNLYTGGMFTMLEKQLRINKDKFQQDVMAEFNSFPIKVATNLGLKNIQLSPDRILFIDNVVQGEGQLMPPSLDIINGDSSYNDMQMLIDARQKQALTDAGLPPSIVSQQTAPQAGISRVIERLELIETREEDIEYLTTFEQEMARIILRVANTDNVTTVDEQARLVIKFADERVYIDPADEYQLDKGKVRDGVLTVADFYRKWAGYRHDIPDEEILSSVSNRMKEAVEVWGEAMPITDTAIQQEQNVPNTTP